MKLYSWSQGVSNSHSNALMAKNAAKSNLSNLISVRNQQKELKNKIDSSLVELDEASEQLVIIKHSASLLSRTGFLGVIFSEVLKSIEISANELISFMPNINMLTLKLSSSTTTKTGKVNQKIEKSVMMDGKQVSIDSLSGGQRASLELCTDLAVSEAIRGRFGVDLGWVALDEAFDGLDVNTKMAALEIIKSKVNGLLIVVDHSSEIKEVFDKVVEVTFDGRQSKVSI